MQLALATFGILQLRWLRDYVAAFVPNPRDMATLQRTLLTTGGSIALAAIAVGTATGYIAPWTGRFYSLLDPTYAKKHIPIIASGTPCAWTVCEFPHSCCMCA